MRTLMIIGLTSTLEGLKPSCERCRARRMQDGKIGVDSCWSFLSFEKGNFLGPLCKGHQKRKTLLPQRWSRQTSLRENPFGLKGKRRFCDNLHANCPLRFLGNTTDIQGKRKSISLYLVEWPPSPNVSIVLTDPLLRDVMPYCCKAKLVAKIGSATRDPPLQQSPIVYDRGCS